MSVSVGFFTFNFEDSCCVNVITMLVGVFTYKSVRGPVDIKEPVNSATNTFKNEGASISREASMVFSERLLTCESKLTCLRTTLNFGFNIHTCKGIRCATNVKYFLKSRLRRHTCELEGSGLCFK